MGARVIAAVSSEDKAEFCRQIGADETIIYAREMDKEAQKSFSKEIKTLAGSRGVDVVYDAVGGGYAEPALRSIAWNGRFLVVGFPAGIPKIPLNLPLLKGCQIIGVFWGASVFQDPQGHQNNVSDLFDLHAKGLIRPQISARFQLADAGKALTSLSQRSTLGKIVITIP